jgi:hypothetical protein
LLLCLIIKTRFHQNRTKGRSDPATHLPLLQALDAIRVELLDGDDDAGVSLGRVERALVDLALVDLAEATLPEHHLRFEHMRGGLQLGERELPQLRHLQDPARRPGPGPGLGTKHRHRRLPSLATLPRCRCRSASAAAPMPSSPSAVFLHEPPAIVRHRSKSNHHGSSHQHLKTGESTRTTIPTQCTSDRQAHHASTNDSNV